MIWRRSLLAPVLISVLVISALVVAGCGGSPGGAGGGASRATATVGDEGLFAAPADATLAIELRDVLFDKKQLEVVANRVVEIGIKNTGTVDHDFTIEKIDAAVGMHVPGDAPPSHEHLGKYAVHVPLKPKQAGQLRLRVRTPGTYEYVCVAPGHKEAGMKGTLVVK